MGYHRQQLPLDMSYLECGLCSCIVYLNYVKKFQLMLAFVLLIVYICNIPLTLVIGFVVTIFSMLLEVDVILLSHMVNLLKLQFSYRNSGIYSFHVRS